MGSATCNFVSSPLRIFVSSPLPPEQQKYFSLEGCTPSKMAARAAAPKAHSVLMMKQTACISFKKRFIAVYRKGLFGFSLPLFVFSSLPLFDSSFLPLFVSLTLSLLVCHPFARFVSKTVLHQRTPLRERSVKVNVGGKVRVGGKGIE